MMEIISLPDERIVGLRVAGKIDKADVDKVVGVVEEKLHGSQKLRIYVEHESIEGISFEALAADIKLATSHLGDFERKAVVSDKKWAELLVKLGDKLFPSIEVRHFTWEQKDAALAWLRS